MKRRALGIVLAIGLLAASAALAAPPPGKGKKPATTGANCKPAVAVILTGTLTSDGSATLPFNLSMTVTGANKLGQAYKKATQPVSVQVTDKTKVTRQGSKSAAALKAGDRVNVQARACKADLANGATPAPLATRVTAHPAATTTTTTTTTP